MSAAPTIPAHDDAPTPIRAGEEARSQKPDDPASSPAPLTITERAAFVGMQARQREIVEAFNREEREIVGEVEARLGLAPGSIGVSHNIDPQAWAVVAAPQPAANDAD